MLWSETRVIPGARFEHVLGIMSSRCCLAVSLSVELIRKDQLMRVKSFLIAHRSACCEISVEEGVELSGLDLMSRKLVLQIILLWSMRRYISTEML